MPSRAAGMIDVLFGEFLLSVVRFPIWWYTTGLSRVSRAALNGLRYRAEEYSFAIWIRHFFVPMYGQYDLAGRFVSVLMRFVVLVGRLIAFVIEALLYALGLLLWMLAPFLIIMFGILNLLKTGSL